VEYRKDLTEIERVDCEVCLKEIPASEATSSEASDYVIYFCGLECYEKWRKEQVKMFNLAWKDGWEHLPNGFDVEFRNSIPVRVSDNGRGLTVPQAVLIEEISALSKLHVHLDEWTSGEAEGEYEARVFASDKDLTEVLRRLARASAAVFTDRYHKTFSSGDVDWDRLAYRRDFHESLNYCELSGGDVEAETYFEDYVNTMHMEINRLVKSGEPPPVVSE